MTSSKVAISDSLVAFKVSISTIPRSDSLAVSTVAIFSFSAFLRRSSLVISLTSLWAAAACAECSTPRASTIWLFQSGIVLTSVDWIFSAIIVSFPCTRRICGAVCMAIVLVSSRSCSFFSKRSHLESRSFAACASSASPLAIALFFSSCSSPFLVSASFCFPASTYMANSL